MSIQVGDRHELSKVITLKDIRDFSKLTLDKNPLHLDSEFSKRSVFGKPIAHGFLVASLISAVLGGHLPGPGTIYLSQQINFRKPVFPGDEITASVEVVEIRNEKGILILKTQCQNQAGEIVIDGEATVMLQKDGLKS
jgi:acyl dehydratase